MPVWSTCIWEVSHEEYMSDIFHMFDIWRIYFLFILVRKLYDDTVSNSMRTTHDDTNMFLKVHDNTPVCRGEVRQYTYWGMKNTPGYRKANFTIRQTEKLRCPIRCFPCVSPGLALILLLLSIAIFGTVAMYTDQVRFQASERRWLGICKAQWANTMERRSRPNGAKTHCQYRSRLADTLARQWLDSG